MNLSMTPGEHKSLHCLQDALCLGFTYGSTDPRVFSLAKLVSTPGGTPDQGPAASGDESVISHVRSRG